MTTSPLNYSTPYNVQRLCVNVNLIVSKSIENTTMLLVDHKQHKKTYNKRLNREKDNRKKHRPSRLARSFPLPRLTQKRINRNNIDMEQEAHHFQNFFQESFKVLQMFKFQKEFFFIEQPY
jgi:hypothetical protein